jgi:hypothetical protein
MKRINLKWTAAAVVLVAIFAMGQAGFRLPAGSVTNREVSNTAGVEIEASKLWHLDAETCNFDLESTATPTTQTKTLFQAHKAGKLTDDVSASLYDSGTSTAVTFDVKKNGSTIMSAAISVVHGTGDRVPVAGTWTSDAARTYAAGDVISCTVTATSTTGAQGPTLNYVRQEQGD